MGTIAKEPMHPAPHKPPAQPAPSGDDQTPQRIRAMFARIVPSYDRLNFLLSGSMDRRWRRRAARELTRGLEPCRRVLDVASGTGDLARAVREVRPDAVVLGVDFTGPMLARAQSKYGRDGYAWIEGDGLRLPVVDGAFDGACIAFGLRNMEDKAAGVAEMRRALRPGGRVAILEFSQPPHPLLRRLYDFYSFTLMPRLGRLLSGSDAYLYLPQSIRGFPPPDRLAAMMRGCGFENVRWISLMGGIVCLHLGTARRMADDADSI